MRKRVYRAISLSNVNQEQLLSQLPDGRVVVGVDVAKNNEYAVVMDESQKVHLTLKWIHPKESQDFVALLRKLAEHHPVEVAMEPTATYSDAMRGQLLMAGFPVYQVHCKRSHDAAEVYDGVPSWHDAKSAAIVGKLHLDGVSRGWPLKSDEERSLRAALRLLDMHERFYQANVSRLESQLAVFWPELLDLVELTSVTLLEVLSAYGGPEHVAAHAEQARERIRRVGRYPDWQKADAIIQSARTTIGVPQIKHERQMMMTIASEARRSQKEAKRARREVERLTETSRPARAMAPVVGRATAAVLVAAVGDPKQFESAKAYVKSFGLNLREKSSGKQKHRGLHITKRGSGVARKHLYMAALRLIRTDPVLRAWHLKKVRRQGGQLKRKSVVALMRKLAMAMWHVARGSTFDSTRLFDVRRLDVTGSRAA
jgi:transposase